jgi:DNA-binding response OmpR family regulator
MKTANFGNKSLSKNNSNKRNKTVLVIEDDQIVAKLLKHTFERRGFIVQVAGSGNEAIANLETQEPPNLILLDIVLPHFDGFEILKKIRTKKGWVNVPTIMLTSKTQEGNVVRAFDHGADDYITKPFQIEELFMRINRLMR